MGAARRKRAASSRTGVSSFGARANNAARRNVNARQAGPLRDVGARSKHQHRSRASLVRHRRARAGGARSGRGGGFGGRGGGGGFGGAGGANTSRSPASTLTPEERNRLRELTDQVKRSSAALVIAQSDPGFTVTDSQGHTQMIQTDGSIDQRQLASVYVDSSAHWDDSRLVIEYVVSVDRKLLYTHTLLPKTMQLVVRITLDAPETRRGGSPEVKLVYNRTPSDK